jgi:hypothetical protein
MGSPPSALKGPAHLRTDLRPWLGAHLTALNLLDAAQDLTLPSRVNLVLGLLGHAVEQCLADDAALLGRQTQGVIEDLSRLGGHATEHIALQDQRP